MSDTTRTTSAAGVDAATFIEDRIRHGEHVVADSVTGTKLLHPGCAMPCEYANREITDHPRTHGGVYIAALAADGTIVARGDR